MFELFKVVWDLYLLRDATQKGQMNWRIWAIAIGLVVFLYGTAVPVSLIWDKYPQYQSLFVLVFALDVVAFLWVMIWGTRRYLRQLSAAKANAGQPN